ncbi:MAG TPA: alpha/beta hydrolase [Steroidobacteraceae bacterium]|nr:alpha/beta hydrolase [Steroidobacteraceae bacterium]
MSDLAGDYYFSSADGLRLYCAVYGTDRPGTVPVLCLPGLTRNSRDFAVLARRLSSRRQVLAADLRGRGRSEWDGDPSRYQPGTYVQDAWSLLDARRVSRVLVIGTSLGALIGMTMAAMAPQRIAGLVLNDAGPEIDPVGARRIASYVGRLPQVSSWSEAAAQAKTVYGAALPGLSDAQWLDYARRGYRENEAGVPVADVDPRIAEAFRTPATAAPADLWTLYARIRNVPMLVIRGALSDILSATTVARMVREQPQVECVTVANRGHAPLLDEHECVAAIDAFVARHGSRAPSPGPG